MSSEEEDSPLDEEVEYHNGPQLSNAKISESYEGEAECDEDEKENTVGDIDTPQNEDQLIKFMQTSNKTITFRKKSSTKNTLKSRLMGDNSMQNLFRMVKKNESDKLLLQVEESKVFGTVDDAEALFGHNKIPGYSESLDSITSQRDSEAKSLSSTGVFTYETEKRLFAPISLKNKSRRATKAGIMKAFKHKSTSKYL